MPNKPVDGAGWSAWGAFLDAFVRGTSSVGKALLTAVDAAAARSVIGAGTSSLGLGTTSSTAKAGDYVPDAASVTNLKNTVLAMVAAAFGSQVTYNATTGTFLINFPQGTSSPTDTTAPVITSFAAYAGNGQASLSWAATDSVGVTRSVITRAGATVYDGSGTNATVTGLTNGTAYTFTLTVYDAAGNSQTATTSVTPAVQVTGAFAPARWTLAANATPLVRVVAPNVDLDTGVVTVSWVGSLAPGATQASWTARLDKVAADGTVIAASAWTAASTGSTAAAETVTVSPALVAGAFYQPYVQITDSAGRQSALEAGARFVVPSGTVHTAATLIAAGCTTDGTDCYTAFNNWCRAGNLHPGDRVKLWNNSSTVWGFGHQDFDQPTYDGVIFDGRGPNGEQATVSTGYGDVSDVIYAGFRITRPCVRLRDIHYTVPGSTLYAPNNEDRRARSGQGTTASDPRSCPFYVEGNLAIGVIFERLWSQGSIKAGILLRGNGSNGPSYCTIVDCVAQDSWADAFHATEGSHHITFTRPKAVRPGDDGFADVGYGQNGAAGMPHHITWEDVWLVDQTNGRGFSAIGARDILCTIRQLDRAAAAAIYLGAENSMQSSVNVQVKPSTTAAGYGLVSQPNYMANHADLRKPSQNVVDAGAVLILSNDSGQVQTGISVTGLTFTNQPGGSTYVNDFYLSAVSYGGDYSGCSIAGTLAAGSQKRTTYLNKSGPNTDKVGMTLTVQ